VHIIIAGNEDFILNDVGFFLNTCDDRGETINNVIAENWSVGEYHI
jgi:hypothetical protein